MELVIKGVRGSLLIESRNILRYRGKCVSGSIEYLGRGMRGDGRE